jgi:hypothetical protein
MLKKFLRLLTRKNALGMTPMETWLSESVDLVDLERRQRMIERGQVRFN